MRPISGLCHFRKLLGYLWMDALPLLQWMSPQAGFVLASCVVVSLRRLPLCSQGWQNLQESATLQVYVGQLDLTQAFVKIKHSAVIEALFEKQVPLQLMVVLVEWWSQSEVSVRLQSVSSHRKIRVQRGVPQGSPESPLVFVITTDCALGNFANNLGLSQIQVGPLSSPLGRLRVSCLALCR